MSDEGSLFLKVYKGSRTSFFLIIHKRLAQCLKCYKFYLFADDTSLFYSNKKNQLEEIINSELLKISDWFISNKLTLNMSKSNFMIIKPRQRKLSKNIK